MLFIDEFQVEDVSDAMTLVNLLGELKKRGVFLFSLQMQCQEIFMRMVFKGINLSICLLNL